MQTWHLLKVWFLLEDVYSNMAFNHLPYIKVDTKVKWLSYSKLLVKPSKKIDIDMKKWLGGED
jgi:hypothetical protein